MPRPQFSLKTLLWLMLVVAAFVGGIRFERERRRREDQAAAEAGQRSLYRLEFSRGPLWADELHNPADGKQPVAND
jgi:hypothetical protein